MLVADSFGNSIPMCEMWSSAINSSAFWHDNRCLRSHSVVCAWRNRKVSATSCRYAFDWIVSKSIKLYYTTHLDSNTVGYRYYAVQYIMLLHAVLQWQQHNIDQILNPQKTLYHEQAMGCLLWVSREKLHRYNRITLYMNMFKAQFTVAQRG